MPINLNPGFPIGPVLQEPSCPGGQFGSIGPTLASVFSGFYARWVIPDYSQTAFWLKVITDQTPGAIPAEGFDPKRYQETVYSDNTYGVGWFAPYKGVIYGGYIPMGSFACGVNDVAKIEEYRPGGIVIYEGPVIIYQPPVSLSRQDIVVISDGRRFVVGDTVTPAQVHGATILRTDKLNGPSQDTTIYSIPINP